MSLSRNTHTPDPSPIEARAVGRWFTAVRRRGLLSALSPDAWHTLSALLSFRTHEGQFRFTLEQLAYSLGAPFETAEARLTELLETLWEGAPMGSVQWDTQGAVVGADLQPLDLIDRVSPAPLLDAETETEDPDSQDAGQLSGQLAEVGLYPDQIERLLSQFPEERIRRQLAFLPARKARIPAALLVRAIEGDWEPPKEDR